MPDSGLACLIVISLFFPIQNLSFDHHSSSVRVSSKESAKESILLSYKHGFSGFAAVLSQSQAKLIISLE